MGVLFDVTTLDAECRILIVAQSGIKYSVLIQKLTRSCYFFVNF
jgi:hypothetical protein